jgi:hypothetical protein
MKLLPVTFQTRDWRIYFKYRVALFSLFNIIYLVIYIITSCFNQNEYANILLYADVIDILYLNK